MSRKDPTRRTVEFWIKDVPELQFNGEDLYCKCCQKSISWKQKSDVVKHISSATHEKRASGTSHVDKQKDFNLDLVSAMVGANIPWKKLHNPLFRRFLQRCTSGRYTDVQVPTESSLRKNYLSQTSENIRANISSELSGKYIWLSIDETINACGWRMVNILVGALEENSSTNPRLIASKAIEDLDSNCLIYLIHSSLKLLWVSNYKENCDKLLLLITDELPCMEEVDWVLKDTYKNVLYTRSFTHGLNSVAECIRECYPNVDKLITRVQRILLDSPERTQLFHEMLPNVALPPELVSARSGTWIEAASYYYCNSDNVKNALQRLNTTDVLNARKVLADPIIRKDLEYIHANFSRVYLAINRLNPENPEASKLTLIDAINVLFDLRNYIFQLSGSVAEKIKKQFEIMLRESRGFLTMSRLADCLIGKEVDFSESGVNIESLRHFRCFKYAPVACINVEEFSSEYKWIFEEKRRNLSTEHLEQIIVIHFNSDGGNITS